MMIPVFHRDVINPVSDDILTMLEGTLIPYFIGENSVVHEGGDDEKIFFGHIIEVCGVDLGDCRVEKFCDLTGGCNPVDFSLPMGNDIITDAVCFYSIDDTRSQITDSYYLFTL